MNDPNLNETTKNQMNSALLNISMKNMYSNFKVMALKCAACLAAFILFITQVISWGEESSNLYMMNPLISGYLHASWSHFATNLLLLFILMIPAINSSLKFKELFIVTTILSILYLPVSIAGLTPPAIGLSGTCCYLGGRYAWSIKKRGVLVKSFLILLICFELNNFLQPLDGQAHLMHVIGMTAGVFSIVFNNTGLSYQQQYMNFQNLYFTKNENNKRN